jgi:putative glutamine amidotransferase
MRPVVGICSTLVHARWSVWEQESALLPMSYIEAIQRAGGLAVMIPPDPALEREPDEMLDVVDGLILAGGDDIDPGAYGAERHAMTAVTVPERDRPELALARRAIERDIPLLGICRGMQVINVAFGGSLHQHLPDEFGHEDHRRYPGNFDGADHDVRLTPGSVAARAAGEELHCTKSHHHQGIDRVGEGLVVTGRSVLDDLPEAIELPSRRFALGVQWHPEADPSSRVIAALVEQAEAYRSSRGSVYPASRTAAVTSAA